MAKLTKKLLDCSEPRVKDYIIWCGQLKGFGARVFSTGQKSFLIQYRDSHNRTRRFTLGRYGHLTPDQARTEAMKLLGSVRLGKNPSEDRRGKNADISMREFCDHYVEDMCSGRYKSRFNRPKKQSTILTDIGRIETHIKPLLGNRCVNEIDRKIVERFFQDVRIGKTTRNKKSGKKRGRSIVTGGEGTARRTVGLLSGMMTYAVEMGMREANPCHGIRKGSDRKKTRFLRAKEYAALGQALLELEDEGVNSTATSAIRLIALTGCRVGEITNLHRRDIDEQSGCFRFEDTKTGAQIRPIGCAAFELLRSVPPELRSPYVFPATRGAGAYQGLRKVWLAACGKAEIADATMHTLRHSYASVAAELNYSDATIAALLGHSLGTMTSRYTHFVDEALKAAADKVSTEVSDRMSDAEPAYGLLQTG